MSYDQIFLAIFGVIAIWLSQDSRESVRKYSCLFGMISQPFWFYTSYVNEQWGVFILAIFYTIAWMKGFYNHWINPPPKIGDLIIKIPK